jgi:hypothetical protein
MEVYMRELTISEVDQVSGGSNILAAIQEWSTFGATAGTAWGYVTAGTIQGAARGGLAGGALGFAFGSGYAFGSWISGYY